MKIPTILGLSLLITAISLGSIIFYFDKKTEAKDRIMYQPIDIQVLNLSDDQATVVWETTNPTTGSVSYGTSTNLNQLAIDNRDNEQSFKNRLIHFVTIRDLKPNSTYYFKVNSQNLAFPDKTLSFKTPQIIDQPKDSPENKPLRGSVLNINLNPIDEALVILKIPNAQPMGTFTSTAGNFIIPLSRLRAQNLLSHFSITENTPAKLILQKGALKSEVEVKLPLPNNQLLPPLTIGQNVSFQDLITQSQITPREEVPQLENSSRYDLNLDGTINTLDLAVVLQYYGKPISDDSPNELKSVDFNADGKIDQKDIDLLTLNL